MCWLVFAVGIHPMDRWKYDHKAGGMSKLSMECRRFSDFSRVHVLCMSSITGSHAEAGIYCPFDEIALLE